VCTFVKWQLGNLRYLLWMTVYIIWCSACFLCKSLSSWCSSSNSTLCIDCNANCCWELAAIKVQRFGAFRKKQRCHLTAKDWHDDLKRWSYSEIVEQFWAHVAACCCLWIMRDVSMTAKLIVPQWESWSPNHDIPTAVFVDIMDIYRKANRPTYRTVQIVALASFSALQMYCTVLLDWTILSSLVFCANWSKAPVFCSMWKTRWCFMYFNYVPLSCWSNIYTSSCAMLRVWVLCRDTISLPCTLYCVNLWVHTCN